MNKKEILKLKIKSFEAVLKNKQNKLETLKEEQAKHPEIIEKSYLQTNRIKNNKI